MADVTISGAVITSDSALVYTDYRAGATIAKGEVVYLGAANTWLLADANASATTAAVSTKIGIAMHAAASGERLNVVYEDPDFTPGGTLVTGTAYILSANAGKIAPIADAVSGWYVTVLGVAKSTSKLNMKIVKAGAAV